MFDVDAYLTHLGYAGPRNPTLQTLRELHRKHLMMVPFDNSLNAPKGLGVWDAVDTDLDTLFESLIIEGRGGVCHELSGLFRGLLRALGFEVTIMSAGVRGANDEFGPDLEHMFNMVRFGDELWLADVGFAGPSFLEPLMLSEKVQSQYGFAYRVTGDSEYQMVQRKTAVDDWNAVYRFRLQERELAEWKAISSLVDEDPGWYWAGEMIAAGTLIHGRAYEDGQLLLVGRRYLKAAGGREEVRALIDADEYRSVVDHILRRGGA